MYTNGSNSISPTRTGETCLLRLYTQPEHLQFEEYQTAVGTPNLTHIVTYKARKHQEEEKLLGTLHAKTIYARTLPIRGISDFFKGYSLTQFYE